MNERLSGALRLARRGYRVLPVDGKRPLIKNWPEAAATDEQQIRAWWEQWPDANVGVLTGGPLVVLDIDPRNGGIASLKQLVRRYGRLPRTLKIATGGGGWHYYFDNRSGPISSGPLAPGVDVKADGGCVVAPPSIHPETNEPYTFEGRRSRAEVPEWVRMERGCRPRAGKSMPHIIRGGLRNNTLFRFASSLVARGTAEAEIHAALVAINDARCQPPLDAQEVARIAGSAVRYLQAWRDAPLTDLGNAERLVIDHGQDLMYVPGHGWHTWDGTRWKPDATGEVQRRAASTVRKLREVGAALDDPDDVTRFMRHSIRSEQNSRLAAMVDLAATQADVVVVADRLNRDPFLLNVRNGTLDLRTGKLRPHRRRDRLTKLASVEFNDCAECPRWERFVDEVLAGDTDLVAYMKRLLGYCLTGDTREQCLVMLVGEGANGKTTLIETFADLLGSYAVRADASSFTTSHKRSVRSDLARLLGARLVPAVEIEANAQLAEVLVKQVTGGDAIVASFLYRGEFEFTPTFKVILAANQRPIVRGQDHAIWRRIKLIPFTVRFHKPDRGLRRKLAREHAGILNWALAGCLQWQKSGLGSTRAVDAALSGYREDMDPVRDFFDTMCEFDPRYRTSSAVLWSAYGVWANNTGVTYPLSRDELNRRMTAQGLRNGRGRIAGSVQRYWEGVRLREEEAR